MSTLKNTDSATDYLLDFIAVHESNGNYNAVIGNANATDDLSRRTINGIYVLQDQLVGRGEPSSAVGRYQIIKDTLRDIVAAAKISGAERFTPALQDRLAVALLVRRGYSDWWRGEITDEDFAGRLSEEWASLPDPRKGGRSHYDGVGKNHAAYTLAQVYAALAEVRRRINAGAPVEDEPAPAPKLDPALVARAIAILSELQAALALLCKEGSKNE